MSGIRQYVVFVSDIFPLAYAFEIHPCCMHLNLFIKSPVHCCCSVAQSCRTLCDPLDCSTPGFPVLHSFPEFAKLMSIESVMTPNHVILCHPLLLLLQSFPTSGSFPVSRLFASGGQSIGASASVLPMNIQGRFPLGLTGLISLLSNGLSRVFSSTTVRKCQFFSAQPSLRSFFMYRSRSNS